MPIPNSLSNPSQGMVLFVEDHPDTRVLLSEQLKALQYDVVPMEHGAEALAWLDGHLPDVVILDWMLPDIDGIEICRRIRTRYTAIELPVLILSTLVGDPENRIMGLQAGANEFMEKPFLIRELQARLNALIALRKT